MSRHRAPRSGDDSTLDRLLDGTDHGHGSLNELLAAARAPGTPRELAGEEAALSAFRVGRSAWSSAGSPAPARRSLLRRLVTVKAGTLAALAVLGGVALAAGTGVLPLPVSPPAKPDPASSTGSLPRTTAASVTRTPASPRPTALPPAVPPSGKPAGPTVTPGRPAGTTIAERYGYCQALLTYQAKHPGQRWPNPHLAELVQAAGGADKVDSYCASLVASTPPRPGNSQR